MFRTGLPLSLVILRGKLLSLSTWTHGSPFAVADGGHMIRALRDGRVRELVDAGAVEWPEQTAAFARLWARLVVSWAKVSPDARQKLVCEVLDCVSAWIDEADGKVAEAVGRVSS